jgi:hypothetical protein
MGTIIFIAWPGPGEGELVLLAPAEKLPIDELRTVITIDAQDWKRERGSGFLNCSKNPLLGFILNRQGLGPASRNIGNVQRETELASTIAAFMTNQVDLHEPRHPSSHWAQVRIGMESFNSDPGLVWERPRSISLARSAASGRSIVTGEIFNKSAAVASSILSSLNRRSLGTKSGRPAASNRPHGVPWTADKNRNAVITGSP